MFRSRHIALVAVLALATRADAQKRPLAIEDYYRFKTISAPELSPDGRWVAFTVGIRIEETSGQLSEVWVVSLTPRHPREA